MHEAGEASGNLAARLRAEHPELAAVEAVAGEPVYVVGGAVRDQLLGRGRADLDLVVVGDAAALAERLGPDLLEHQRFGTAKVAVGGHELDIAGARTETYSHPGALPTVAAAGSIEADLRRRDFSVNAIAVPLTGGAPGAEEGAPLDPWNGQEDLAAGLLRVLHDGSFVDDPTRAIRAARYAARLGFDLAPRTAELIRAADLDTVSADRREAELLRLAAEPSAPLGFELLAGWGLVEPRPEGVALARRVGELLADPRWAELSARDRAVLAAALGPQGREAELARARPAQPSEAVGRAAGRPATELVLARALGAAWLDDYLERWREVALEIDGRDLIAAGVPEGPALGRGLEAALRAKLDGRAADRNQELAIALDAARSL